MLYPLSYRGELAGFLTTPVRRKSSRRRNDARSTQPYRRRSVAGADVKGA